MQAKMYFIGRFGKSQEPLQLASCSWLKINWNRIWCHWYGPITLSHSGLVLSNWLVTAKKMFFQKFIEYNAVYTSISRDFFERLYTAWRALCSVGLVGSPKWDEFWLAGYVGPIKFEILRREYVTLVYAAPSTCRVPVPLSRVQDKHAFYVYKNKNYTVRPYTYQKSKMCNGPML